MFLLNWLREKLHREKPLPKVKPTWDVPFVNFRYRDTRKNIDVSLNMALIGINDTYDDSALDHTLMELAQGFVNAINQEKANKRGDQ